jgi:hypothetical protein
MPGGVNITVVFPAAISLTAAQAAQLEGNLHNAVELALAPLFPGCPPRGLRVSRGRRTPRRRRRTSVPATNRKPPLHGLPWRGARPARTA